uniref:Pep_M12B_propep domain-containing protein n=1 Tax=Anopheles albimanus TaxID=7167 RepID=A0A182FRY0_ANOAL
MKSLPSRFCIVLLLVSFRFADSSHQGIYTHHLGEAGQLVIPRKVNHLGETITHVLTHHHNDDGASESRPGGHQRRRRRSTPGQPEDSSPTSSSSHPELLQYHIDVGDETLHLELEPSTASFVAPLMVVERHRRDVRTRVHPHSKHINCHYQGQIRGHDHSRVALSACSGLVSIPDRAIDFMARL